MNSPYRFPFLFCLAIFLLSGLRADAARRNRVVGALVLISFAASWAFAVLPLVAGLSAGTRTLILTVSISAIAAALFPVKEKEGTP